MNLRLSAIFFLLVALVIAGLQSASAEASPGSGAHSGHAHAHHGEHAQQPGKHSAHTGTGSSHDSRGAVPCPIMPDQDCQHCAPCHMSSGGIMASAGLRLLPAKKFVPSLPPAFRLSGMQSAVSHSPPVTRLRRIRFQPGPVHGDPLLVTRRLRI